MSDELLHHFPGLDFGGVEISHGDQEWYEHGFTILDDLRSAMHGDINPRDLDPGESGHWLAYGRRAERVEVGMLGSPPLNHWLIEPDAQAAVSEVASGALVASEAAQFDADPTVGRRSDETMNP